LGELAGIAQEIEEDLPQLRGIGNDALEAVGYVEQDRRAILLGRGLAGLNHLAHQRFQSDRLFVQLHAAGLDFGDVEHVVNKAAKVLGGLLDFAEIGHLPAAVEFGILEQQLAVSDDGVQRGAQLVAHAGQEGAFGGARLFGRFLGTQELARSGLDLPFDALARAHSEQYGDTCNRKADHGQQVRRKLRQFAHDPSHLLKNRNRSEITRVRLRLRYEEPILSRKLHPERAMASLCTRASHRGCFSMPRR
jgi:hypothetical protein